MNEYPETTFFSNGKVFCGGDSPRRPRPRLISLSLSNLYGRDNSITGQSGKFSCGSHQSRLHSRSPSLKDARNPNEDRSVCSTPRLESSHSRRLSHRLSHGESLSRRPLMIGKPSSNRPSFLSQKAGASKTHVEATVSFMAPTSEVESVRSQPPKPLVPHKTALTSYESLATPEKSAPSMSRDLLAVKGLSWVGKSLTRERTLPSKEPSGENPPNFLTRQPSLRKPRSFLEAQPSATRRGVTFTDVSTNATENAASSVMSRAWLLTSHEWSTPHALRKDRTRKSAGSMVQTESQPTALQAHVLQPPLLQPSGVQKDVHSKLRDELAESKYNSGSVELVLDRLCDPGVTLLYLNQKQLITLRLDKASYSLTSVLFTLPFTSVSANQ